MAFHLSLHLPHLISHSHSHSRRSVRSSVNASEASHCKSKKQRNRSKLATKNALFGLFFRCCASPKRSSPWSTLSSATSSSSFASVDETISDSDDEAEGKAESIGFDQIDGLVWELHESARSFSVAVESLKLTGSGPELSMAWVGKDVHGWHKRISYMVAVYALLKTAIEMEVLLSHERHFSNSSPVKEILTPKINLVGEYIKSQLDARHSSLGEWFREVELPRVAASFVPLLKKWSMKYAGSGVAGIVVAISCCVAIGKLSVSRLTCSSFALSIEDVMVEFFDRAQSLVLIEKLHQLSTQAGFESEFLNHFGRKVVPSKKSEELEFWIGLAQKKLSKAFHKEILISEGHTYPEKVEPDTLATLGLFAYLGRRTRLFLSTMGIEDLDEPVRDFLSYLECGSIFIYQEFSCISMYQSFMEVVNDEIGWLDFYDPFPPTRCQDRRRSKPNCLQAEKEIVLSTVLTICYDVFSGFAHFTRSTQQLLDTDLLMFLLESQKLLTFCLEDYWAVYGKSSEFLKITETSVRDPTLSALNARGVNNTSSVNVNTNGSPTALHLKRATILAETGTVNPNPKAEKSAAKSSPLRRGLVKKYTVKLMAASSDIWMGTQLLCVDITIALELLSKRFHGCKIERREREKLKRTLNDIGSLIPITILMLLPVSAIGHAAILAAIKQYMPCMIPSPYSSERLDVMKQLERTKKMEERIQSNYEDPSKIS